MESYEIIDYIPPVSQRNTARMLGIDVRTLMKWRGAGIINPVGTSTRYEIREIIRVVNRRNIRLKRIDYERTMQGAAPLRQGEHDQTDQTDAGPYPHDDTI